MKTAAIDREIASVLTNGQRSRLRAVADFAELVKARLTLLVLLTTAVGFYLGAENPISYPRFFHALFGTALAAASAAALNQWWERRPDALMRRTKMRPIPAGRMLARDALVIGLLLATTGIIYLALRCNALAAALPSSPLFLNILPTPPRNRISTANTLT